MEQTPAWARDGAVVSWVLVMRIPKHGFRGDRIGTESLLLGRDGFGPAGIVSASGTALKFEDLNEARAKAAVIRAGVESMSGAPWPESWTLEPIEDVLTFLGHGREHP